MNREQAIELATATAISSTHRHSYMPSVANYDTWLPHTWVVEAILAAYERGAVEHLTYRVRPLPTGVESGQSRPQSPVFDPEDYRVKDRPNTEFDTIAAKVYNEEFNRRGTDLCNARNNLVEAIISALRAPQRPPQYQREMITTALMQYEKELVL